MICDYVLKTLEVVRMCDRLVIFMDQITFLPYEDLMNASDCACQQ